MTTDRPAAARNTSLVERPSSSARHAAPPSDGFAALLDAHAPAGAKPARPEPRAQRNTPQSRPEPTRADAAKAATADRVKPGADPLKAGDAPEAPGASTDAAVTVAPDQAPVLVALSCAIPVEPTPATPEEIAAQLASPLPAPPQPVAPQPAADARAQGPVVAPAPSAAQPAPDAPQPIAPQVAAPAPIVPAASTPSTPAADPAVAVDGAVPAPVTATDAKPAPAPANAADAQPSATKPADAPPQSGAGTQGQPSQPQPGTPTAPAAAQEAVAATPVTDVPAPAAAAPAAPASQPVQAAPAAVPAPATSPLERAVPLYRAAYATAALIHIASERGITHARINLKPAELGGIEVRLHSSPEGVSARLVADSPEAARALTQAGDDLRRQLEARGVTLLSLDVSTSDDERRQAPAFGGDAAGHGSGSNGARAGAQAEAAPAAAPAETTLVLPDGLLVDVLA